MARDLNRERGRPPTEGEPARVRLEDEVEEGLTPPPARVFHMPGAETPAPVERGVLVSEEEALRIFELLRLTAGRERWAAKMNATFIETARLLEPLLMQLNAVVGMLTAKVLAIGALLAAAAVTYYTLTIDTSWPRVALTAVFIAFAGWLIRKAQK